MPKPSHLAAFGVATEAGTPGVPAAATMWIPWKTLTPKDDVMLIDDKGQRGAPVDSFGIVQGPKGATLDFGGDVFADSIGFPLVSLLPDVVVSGTSTGSGGTTLSSGSAVGASSISTAASIPAATAIQIGVGVLAEVRTTGTPSGAGPYTIPITGPVLTQAHLTGAAVQPVTAPYLTAFSTLCTGDTQPPTQTYTIFDPLGTWQYPGEQLSEVGFKWNADGLFEYSAKAMGWTYATTTSPTVSNTAVKPIANWAVLNKIAGAQVFVQDGEITLKRAVTAIRGANGTQNPYRIWSGDIIVEGKLTLVMEDLVQRNIFQASTAQSFDVSFASGSGVTATGLQLHCTTAVWSEGTPNYGKDYIELPVAFKTYANTTDIGVSGGYSPIKATLTNALTWGTYK